MEIDGTPIKEGSVFFVAEAGVNHEGDMERAIDLIDVAAESGADAIKFQTFSADRLVTERADKPAYQRERKSGDETQYEMLRRYELDRSNHEALLDRCEEAGITFLSTPFDPLSADMLDDLDVAALKVGSGDLTNHPLLAHVAGLGRPVILSTGMADLGEVAAATDVIHDASPDCPLVVLHCTSDYPTRTADVNLRAMSTMDEAFEVPVGYSDHTTDVETPGFAVAAGASVVEKHFTMDRSLPGPDHAASLEPDELADAVRIARDAATARGSPEKRPVAAEKENRRLARRSIHAAAAITCGERFTRTNVEITRPADGLPPAELDALLGANATRNFEAGEPIEAGDVSAKGGDAHGGEP